jgi:hypothetical protein
MSPGIVRSLRRRQRADERLVPYDSISRLIISVLIFPSLAFSDFLSPPFQMYLGLIERSLATRPNILMPRPMLIRSSSVIAREDHARPGSPGVFKLRPPITNNISGPTTTPINIMRNLRLWSQLPEAALRPCRLS